MSNGRELTMEKHVECDGCGRTVLYDDVLLEVRCEGDEHPPLKYCIECAEAAEGVLRELDVAEPLH